MEVSGQNASSHVTHTQEQVSQGISYSFLYMVLGTFVCAIANIIYCFKNSMLQSAINSIKRLVLKILGDQEDIVPPADDRIRDETCGVCMLELQVPVQFLCRHELCGACFVQYWTVKDRQKLQCPMCRRNIDIVLRKYEQLPNFTETEQSNSISKQIRIYNLKYSGQRRSAIQMLRDMPFLVEQSVRFVFTWRGFTFFLRRFLINYTVVVMIIYLLSPFDLIPEIIFGVLGLIDDLVVFVCLMVMFSNIYYSYTQSREQNEQA